ncbi:putative structural protein [uncultured Caudovirales phage]|uniref:Putative structural protein n=1 Tax=uncultured Caudovirales phage TaxID=2100421 RepID=A0A2H4J9C3_9CAUD|nr:hypothetical protein [Pseudomonas faucium]ASN70994.1 hypothetical protein 7F10_1 [uncultured Caudovirales phage]ASN71095.1 hypothetical protein 3S10_1 [uncultured Caudovirales phage]ASN71265.1 hypothetical protein 7AX5_1 [uncultured Caudovirales phage]ASN71314.1 putative structural protein [uncultured Caudovirales phage]ASN71361.1 putative structural protein [uncultured Caudovirales phage]
MQRISAFTDQCTPQGLFRYGTTAGGVPPTPVKAEFLNLLQEELCNLVLAYLPALDANDNTQLLKAVRKLVLNYYTKPETDDLLATLKQTIQGLLDLKAPLASPVFTGTPQVPTAAAGTKTKQAASTEFVQAALAGAYPVGSIYINGSSSTNPATLLGFGVWQAAGTGRVLIGAGSGTDARGEAKSFTGGATGGEYNHVLTVSEMPEHAHPMPQGSVAPSGTTGPVYASGDDVTRTTIGSETPDTGKIGGGAAHNNLQPYLVVYMWQRTS